MLPVVPPAPSGASCGSESPSGRARGDFYPVPEPKKGGRLRRWLDGSELVRVIRRRLEWFGDNPSFGTLWNNTLNVMSVVLKRERLPGLPSVVKIDISPLCNLHCTVCVHAEPHGREKLESQHFHSDQYMTLEQYRRIIDEIRGRTSAVSLYYLGDPLIHPDLDEMCRIARDAGLNVHISTNLSFRLSDERITSIVRSGVTHFTACVDGLSQEKYERTRVGGKIDLVLDNLRRLCAERKRLRAEWPKFEVQYIKFRHNLDELEAARKLVLGMGVNKFTEFFGALHNGTDMDPEHLRARAPRDKARLPRCFFPYSTMVIKYDGEVIPCCCHRQGQQYHRATSSPTLGNVFDKGVRKVWNGAEYRSVRRMMANPRAAAEAEGDKLSSNFCNACPMVFETASDDIARFGDRHTFEELYALNRKGRPEPLAAKVAASATRS
jgi:MoaA/NifB/PqqE/SkfB family radical SAM enzyme